MFDQCPAWFIFYFSLFVPLFLSGSTSLPYLTYLYLNISDSVSDSIFDSICGCLGCVRYRNRHTDEQHHHSSLHPCALLPHPSDILGQVCLALYLQQIIQFHTRYYSILFYSICFNSVLFYFNLLCLIWYDLIRCYMIWFDLIWYDMIWFVLMCSDLIWYDMIWFDLIWYDMIWYDMIYQSTINQISSKANYAVLPFL